MIEAQIRRSIELTVQRLGVDAVYRRGNVTTGLRIVPTEIMTDTNGFGGGGGVTEKTLRRYLILKEKLLFGENEPFLPVEGDMVVEPSGKMFRVCIFQGETAWKDADNYGISIEFHAREFNVNGNSGSEGAGTAGNGSGQTGEGLLLP